MVDNVANLIIDGKLHEGDTVRIDVGSDDQLFAERDDAASAAAPSEPDGEEPVEPDSVE